MIPHGIYAPIPTPFSDSGDISYDDLARNLERWAGTRLAGLVAAGSNGEFVLLDDDEIVRLLAFTRRRFPTDRPVIAGTGRESTDATIALTRRCADAGADAALVITPSYYKSAMTDAALEAFYERVADESPIPVILYNMPRNTGVNLSAAAAVRLSHHPNIHGIKDSGGNIVQIAEIIGRSADGFFVFAGSGSFLYPALCLGAVGGTLAVANVLPNECAAIHDHVRAGNLDAALKLQMRILDVNAAVTARWGVAGLKAALDMTGYFGGAVRPPLCPLPEQHLPELRRILDEAQAT